MRKSKQAIRPMAQKMRRSAVGLLSATLWFTSTSAALAVPPPPPNGVDGVSVTTGEAEWAPDEQLSTKARRKDAKRYRKKKDVNLSVSINGGRGSVFIDGVWAGEAPVSGLGLKPGRHDVEVRDGETVLGAGILKIKNGSDPVSLSVTAQ